MIIKRKQEMIPSKSKEKLKISQPIQSKKINHNATKNKMRSSASVRNFNPHIIAHNPTQPSSQNQNINTFNAPQKNYINCQKNRNEHTKKNIEEEDKQILTRRLRKSASTGGMKICKSTRKSLSPVVQKIKNENQKPKYSSKQTSRSQKQKIKTIKIMQKVKSTEKLKKTIELKYNEEEKKSKTGKGTNKSTRTTRNHSYHLKTQQSSKMPSISKEIEVKKTKKKKTHKNKEFFKPSKSKAKLQTNLMREKIKNSIIFSDVSFHQGSPLYQTNNLAENYPLKLEYESCQLAKKIAAAIILQKHFRGYLTRKYIEELKFMVSCIIKIQKAWRGYSARNKYKKYKIVNKKNLSIENSLITIKDFSEEPKQQKLKHFKFIFDDLSSQKKQSVRENQFGRKKKSNHEEGMNILQSLLEDEELEESIKEKIRAKMNKNQEVGEKIVEERKGEYVKNKITSEIISEKSFNSPRDLRSPRNNLVIASPSSWAKSKNKSFENVQFFTSPAAVEKVVKRMTSPAKIISPRSQKQEQQKQNSKQSEKQLIHQFEEKQKIVKKEQKVVKRDSLKAFDTSFQFFEQFEMKIIDFMKENQNELENFLRRCKNSQYLKINYIMKTWDKFQESSEYQSQITPHFCIEEDLLMPNIFTKDVRAKVLREPAMQIYLEEKNYLSELWKNNDVHRDAYEGMVCSIFDGLTEAIYDEYKQQSIFKHLKCRSCALEGYGLFTNILMNSLTRVQSWSEYHCGMSIPVEQNDPNYILYQSKKKEREELEVKSSIEGIVDAKIAGWKVWLIVMMGEIIFQQLVEEGMKFEIFKS